MSDWCGGPAASRCQTNTGAAQKCWNQGWNPAVTLTGLKKRARETLASELLPGNSRLCLIRIFFCPPQIWMLTGDKLETATCIAKSSHLVSRNQDIHVFKPVRFISGFPLLSSWRRILTSTQTTFSSLSYRSAATQVSTRGEAHLELNAFRRKHDCALVISGDSLEVCQSQSGCLGGFK